MNVSKEEDTGNWNRRHQIAFPGKLAAEECMDVLQGRKIDGDYEILILDIK
jgi:hypothetical protein